MRLGSGGLAGLRKTSWFGMKSDEDGPGAVGRCNEDGLEVELILSVLYPAILGSVA